jgi:hypothetical protein
MWKIEREPDSNPRILRLSGRIQGDHLAELERLIRIESEVRLTLDLGGVKLVDHEVVTFLAQRESDGIKLRNCPGYIREWINRL